VSVSVDVVVDVVGDGDGDGDTGVTRSAWQHPGCSPRALSLADWTCRAVAVAVAVNACRFITSS
jgi:hypothetical protein